MLQPGTLVGRYEIQRRLGRGGMGTVYVAHDPVLGRLVALKIFLGDLDLADAVDRFNREARSAAALNHPNIVTIHDFGEFSSQPYIVMEYIQGETLTDVIRRKVSVPLVQKLRWLEELCAGVAYAHARGVIHRDIKPTNLMVDRNRRLKILDFGIARILGSVTANGTALIGTPGYMAPEQIAGGTIDFRSDLFSIGIVTYELLTYTAAFPGESFAAITHSILTADPVPLPQLIPAIPSDLAAIVARSLNKSADERFDTAESLLAAITDARRRWEGDVGRDATLEILPSEGGPVASTPRPSSTQRPAANPARVASGVTPPSITSREEILRRRATQIEAFLTSARAALQREDYDAALESCAQARTMDESQPEALELERTIQHALDLARGGALVAEARKELQRGALTEVQDLLQRLRALTPDAPELRQLERELRLARVEQERVRQRATAVQNAIDSANAALARGEIESVLASVRAALELDSTSVEARALEDEAMRRLDEETVDAPARTEVLEPTIFSTRITPRPDVQVNQDVETPTIVASPEPANTVVSTRTTPRVAVRTDNQAAESPRIGGPETSRTSKRPALGTNSAVERVRAYTNVAYKRLSQLLTALHTIIKARPRRELYVLGAMGVLIIAVGIAGVVRPRVPAPTGTLVVDAIPWANIAAIEAADGTQQALPSPPSTPVVVTLPAGTYRIRLVGPPPQSVSREVTLEIKAGGTTISPTESFSSLTAEEYFEPYLSALTPAPGVTPADTDAANPGIAPPPVPAPSASRTPGVTP